MAAPNANGPHAPGCDGRRAPSRGSRRVPKVASAAVAVAAVALVPVAFAGADHGVAPAANSSPDWVRTPGSGDVLWLLRSRQPGSDLGVSGRLPESTQFNPELLVALRDPRLLTAGLSPFGTAPGGPVGVPGVVLDAYLRAAQAMAASNPHCGLSWPVLAAIGRIESNHAHNGRVDAAGNTLERILGPALDGRPGFATISASDGGAWTGDVVWDHAVGPMQFLPGTWKRYGVNAKGYGAADPNNIYDAALAAANFLCSGGEDLRDPAQLAAAVHRYNPSDSYVRTVLAWAAAYAAGVTPLPSLPGMPSAGSFGGGAFDQPNQQPAPGESVSGNPETTPPPTTTPSRPRTTTPPPPPPGPKPTPTPAQPLLPLLTVLPSLLSSPLAGPGCLPTLPPLGALTLPVVCLPVLAQTSPSAPGAQPAAVASGPTTTSSRVR